ncbi:hypothetical protein [Candidatus Spongiihabitans sp.]|uniref:hypothetical protein n=1 Tax=Candidatus Spongiihabitans sp. TaxID=3101308 RepID=UPI003C7E6033
MSKEVYYAVNNITETVTVVDRNSLDVKICHEDNGEERWIPRTFFEQIFKKVSKVKFTVAGQTLLVPEPYTEDHSLNEAEASILNQTYRENIRNGVAAKIKENPDDAQVIVDEYVAGYTFGIRQTRVTLNPVDAEAKKIAIAKVKEALQKKGIKPSDYEQYDEKVASVMAMPEVQEVARNIVEARQNLVSDLLDID